MPRFVGFRSALASMVLATAGAPAVAPAADDPIGEIYRDYQVLLERHLIEQDLPNDGLVSAFEYEAALEHEETEELLERQREVLAEFEPEQLETREAANAFWLNAYNFFMIAHILEERPNGELVDSVWDYGGRINPFRDSVFEQEVFDIGGQAYSLDEMEKGILLGEAFWEKGWAEARVHFAVNCASVGCPPLRAEVYTAENVDDYLTENTRRAFNTERQLHTDGDTLYLSELFDWYEEDYVREEGSIRSFIMAYADDEVIEAVEQTDRVRFIDYDWTLNTPEHFPEFDARR